MSESCNKPIKIDIPKDENLSKSCEMFVEYLFYFAEHKILGTFMGCASNTVLLIDATIIPYSGTRKRGIQSYWIEPIETLYQVDSFEGDNKNYAAQMKFNN